MVKISVQKRFRKNELLIMIILMVGWWVEHRLDRVCCQLLTLANKLVSVTISPDL